MTTYDCPRCHAQLASRNAQRWHALQVEHCYPSTDDLIADRIRERISTLRGQIHLLLLKIPSTRGDDELLAHWYRTIVKRTEQYDYDIHAFRSIAITPEQAVKSVKVESIGRLRRFIQRYDKECYHKWHWEDASQKAKVFEDAWTQEHDCVLASAQTTLRRDIEAQESRIAWVQASTEARV